MIANYHTHTYRCRHASGTDREYIESAIKSGLKVLGFSDHSPQFFKDGFVSGMRMTAAEAPEYVETIRKLAEEYKNEIQILVGFEAEYFPDLFSDLRRFCRDYGVDYMILGQHYLHAELSENHVTRSDVDFHSRLTAYVDVVTEAIATGCFTYIAHPDIVLCPDKDAHYRKEMTRLCLAAKNAGVPLEINMLGCVTGRNYPSVSFFEIAREIGNDFVIGRDAHSLEFLLDPAMLKEAEDFAAGCGITPRDTVELKKI